MTLENKTSVQKGNNVEVEITFQQLEFFFKFKTDEK